jgi:N6-adenosine-specific RNA methylase IME4
MTNRYRTIVADPPWDVKTGPSWGRNDKSQPLNPSSHGLTYETMTVDQIKAIRPPAADGAHLYLWTINAYIEAAYEVARAWGFYPSTLLAWCKKPKGIGLGGTYALSSEYILFAHRGSLPAKRRVERNWWVWPRTFPHSRKPDAFLDLVESVSPGPYLEMFARRNRLGWDTWGNESLDHLTATLIAKGEETDADEDCCWMFDPCPIHNPGVLAALDAESKEGA